MVLPLHTHRSPGNGDNGDDTSGGCGSSCGAGLEKVYPTTAVRYGAMNWIGEFSRRPNMVFKCGAKVVVQTDRGIELGEQVSLSCGGCDKSVSREQIKRYIENSGPEFYRLRSGRVLREATPQDLIDAEHLSAHAREDIDHCQMLAAQLDLDMKIVTVEYLLGGERVVYYFRADRRVDFRALVRELAKHHQTRIELRQVGARDEARLVADYEICGRECCCKNFLKKLRPVTMKMAKLQKSTLDPAKVSGRCGRLRCCLRYEHTGYEELDRKLPRIGTRVESQYGSGVIVDRQILTQLLMVRCDDGQVVALPAEEVYAPGTMPAPATTTETVPPPTTDETSERRPSRRRRRRRPTGRGRPDREEPSGSGREAGPPTAEGGEPPAGRRQETGKQPRSGSRRGRSRRRRRRPRGGGGPDRPQQPE